MTVVRATSDHDQRPKRSRALFIAALGVGQILGWGSSYYLPAVLAKPIAEDTGWPLPCVTASSAAVQRKVGKLPNQLPGTDSAR